MATDGDDETWLYGDENSKDVGDESTPIDKDAQPSTDAEMKDTEDANGEAEGEAQEQENIPPGDKENGDDDPDLGAEEGDAEASVDKDTGEVPGGDDDEDDDDDDSDEDNIQITIDKDKIDAAKTYHQNMQLKKSSGFEFGSSQQKKKEGKFSVEEFDHIGTINGKPATEVEIEDLEDKPWRKPGADITDYFNYGFTEETWTAYCNRQKMLRVNEAGASITGTMAILSSGKAMSVTTIPTLGQAELAKKRTQPTSPTHGKPPMSKVTPTKPEEPSGISVLTHDKRQYTNAPKYPYQQSAQQFSLPPPGFSLPPPSLPPPAFPPPADVNPYGAGYEPTAEAQWSVPPPTWDPSAVPPSSHHPSSLVELPSQYGSSRDRESDRYKRRDDRYRDYDRDRRSRRRSRSRSGSRDRDRDRERDRDGRREREREREKKIKKERRSRSRSRSREHKRRREGGSSSRSSRSRPDMDESSRDSPIRVKEEPVDTDPADKS